MLKGKRSKKLRQPFQQRELHQQMHNGERVDIVRKNSRAYRYKARVVGKRLKRKQGSGSWKTLVETLALFSDRW